MSLKDLESNKYYKYITTVGERAVVYNNRIDNELDLFKELSNSELRHCFIFLPKFYDYYIIHLSKMKFTIILPRLLDFVV